MTDQPRRKRHERRVPPPRMRITARDRQVLEAVYQHRVLSQAQIERLIFTGKHRSIAQERLRLLYDNEYLQRRFLPSVGGIATSPILYLLDKRGSQYLLKDGYDEVRWQPGDNAVGYEHLEHLLAINTFRVEVALACRARDDVTLTEWRDDTSLKQDYDKVVIPGRKQSVAVIPDGYFALATPYGTTHFFLELDRGTMPSKRFKRKILAYLAYYQTGLSEKRFGTAKFRMLTVTESVQRAENLKVATETAGGQSRFWFGVLDDLTAEVVLARPVWQVAGRDELAALIR